MSDARRKVAVKVDFKNAFNCVKRDVFLRAFRRHLPGLSAWAEWTYGTPSHLFFAGEEEVRWRAVRPLRPRREPRQVAAERAQEHVALDAVEGVLEVHLHRDLAPRVGHLPVGVAPLLHLCF